MKGVIKSYEERKKIGYIQSEDNEEYIFNAHHFNFSFQFPSEYSIHPRWMGERIKHGKIIPGKIKTKKPEKGDKVEFISSATKRGKVATSVRYCKNKHYTSEMRVPNLAIEDYFFVDFSNKLGLIGVDRISNTEYVIAKPVFDYVSDERIKKENLYKFCNTNGAKFAKVVSNSKVGVINNYGKWIISAEFDEIGDVSVLATGKRAVLPVKVKGKWGLLNGNKQWVVTPKYDEIGERYQRHEESFLSREGVFFLPSSPYRSQDYVCHLNNEEDVIVRVKKDGKYGMINRFGELVISLKYDSIKEVFLLRKDKCQLNVIKNGYCGLINLDEKWISPIHSVDDICYGDTFHLIYKYGKCGVINAGRKLLLPMEYDSITLKRDVNVAYKNGNMVVLSKDIKPVIAGDFHFETDWKSPFIKIYDKEKKLWGYLSENSELMIPFQFQDCKQFFCPDYENDNNIKYAAVKTVQWGVIDERGKWVLQPYYDAVTDYLNGQFIVKKGSNKTLIDIVDGLSISLNNYEAISGKEEKLMLFTEGLSPVKVNGKWGYINSSNHMVIPPTFERAGHFYEDRAWVAITGEEYGLHPTLWCGYINKKGKFVIGPKYNFHRKIGDFINGRAVVPQTGRSIPGKYISHEVKYYTIDRYGKVLDIRDGVERSYY